MLQRSKISTWVQKNLDEVMEAIKHKNLMVPHVLNTVKCLVEGICLCKGDYTSHFLCSFLLKHLLLTTVRGMTLSLMDLWLNSIWPLIHKLVSLILQFLI